MVLLFVFPILLLLLFLFDFIVDFIDDFIKRKKLREREMMKAKFGVNK